MPDFFFIGEEELLVALRLVGVGGQAVTGREEALEAFAAATGQAGLGSRSVGEGLGSRSIGEGLDMAQTGRDPSKTGRDAKVLILSSEVASSIAEEARAWQFKGEYPLIVEIPSPGASPDEGASLLRAIREAVGINI